MSKVDRCFAGGRWTIAQYKSFIKKTLRRAFMSWPVKHDVLAASKRPASAEALALNPRLKFEYHCAVCDQWFQGKEVQVDHIVECEEIDDLNQVAARMFCEEDGLQVVCKGCHRVKTQAARKKKKLEPASGQE